MSHCDLGQISDLICLVTMASHCKKFGFYMTAVQQKVGNSYNREEESTVSATCEVIDKLQQFDQKAA